MLVWRPSVASLPSWALRTALPFHTLSFQLQCYQLQTLVTILHASEPVLKTFVQYIALNE